MTASRVEGIIGMYVNQHSTAGQGCTEKHNHDKKEGVSRKSIIQPSPLACWLAAQHEHKGKQKKEEKG